MLFLSAARSRPPRLSPLLLLPFLIMAVHSVADGIDVIS